jgi:hypothetical protein
MTSTVAVTPTATRDPLTAWSNVVSALAQLPTDDVLSLRGLSDDVFLQINDLQAQASPRLGAGGALVAGQVAHRSRAALGMSGLAQRTGFRIPKRLLTQTTGVTRQQARTALAAGTLIAKLADDGRVDEVTGEVLAPAQPWLRPVAVAVSDGRISTSAAQSIGAGLGLPNSAVRAGQLEVAATRLVDEAGRRHRRRPAVETRPGCPR